MEIEKAHYEFSDEKNQKLIDERGISFEEIIAAIGDGAVLDVLPHKNFEKYPNQEVYVLNISNYVYTVPFVRKDKNTIFPHRKLTKQYLKGVDYER